MNNEEYMENIEKIFTNLEDFIEKSWFYDNEDYTKVVNVDRLNDFIKWLKNNY